MVNSHLNFDSKHHDKCKFTLKLISLTIVSNLFSLEVVQKCQHCQLNCFQLINSIAGSLLLRITCLLIHIMKRHESYS